MGNPLLLLFSCWIAETREGALKAAEDVSSCTVPGRQAVTTTCSPKILTVLNTESQHKLVLCFGFYSVFWRRRV